MGVGGQRHTPADFTPGRDPVPILQEAGWALGPVWTGAENLAPTGIPSPDCPARSESLCRMSYPGPLNNSEIYEIFAETGRNRAVNAVRSKNVGTTRFRMHFIAVDF